MLKIPNKIETYKEDKESGVIIEDIGQLVYEPVKGEKINIVSWIKYPSYDFLFGTLDKSNPKNDKEVAFFQFRDTRTKKIRQGFYLDKTELNEMIDGFSKIKKHLYVKI